MLTALVRIALSFAVLPAVAAQAADLSPLPQTGSLSKAPDPDHFTFLVAGDNRPQHASDPPTPTIAQIFAAAKKEAPAFVMLCGDTIYGKAPENESAVAAEYQAFLALAQGAGMPVFNAPGNHEMDDENDVPNATMHGWYAKYMAQPYGSFDYGNAHFIALDTEEVAPPGTSKSERAPLPDGKSLDPGYVSAQQLAWLKDDLQANAKKAHIFVFMHHPILPKKAKDGLDAASGKALQKLFAGYRNLSYVVAAHEHLYYNPQGKDGTEPPPSRKDPSKHPPTYLVSGGAGAPLSGKAKHGGYFHYLLFAVKKDEVEVKLVQLGG